MTPFIQPETVRKEPENASVDRNSRSRTATRAATDTLATPTAAPASASSMAPVATSVTLKEVLAPVCPISLENTARSAPKNSMIFQTVCVSDDNR